MMFTFGLLIGVALGATAGIGYCRCVVVVNVITRKRLREILKEESNAKAPV